VALDPLHEPAQRHLMQLYGEAGQKAAALRQYEEYAALLEKELSLPPEEETTTLYEAIKAKRLLTPFLRGEGLDGEGIGEHPSASPALFPPAMVDYNLPPQPTPFIGREKELTEISRLLADEPACRLLTLIGPGGIGKTRLALEAAAAQQHIFRDNVVFVPLAPLSSADFIVSAIASALHLSLQGDKEPQHQLLSYLHQKEVLLVVDNFEHLLEEADLLTEILASTPAVKILVTSRERLNLHAEWVYEVQGLTYPPHIAIERVEDFTAGQLFLQAAQRTRADLEIQGKDNISVVRVCNLLEGMPLALELAAAWVRVLSVEEIAAEIKQGLDLLTTSMRDLPERHRSLRAVFDHSWTLLLEEERAVFRKLSVFRGGFRREGAREVAGASLTLLTALVDKSLLRWTGGERYEVHELLRQYAHEKLMEAGEVEQTRTHHLTHFFAFVEAAKPELERWRWRPEWLERLAEENDNLRAALQWALDSGRVEMALRLGAGLHALWYTRGNLREGREWLETMLALPGAEGETKARAEALSVLSNLTQIQGDYQVGHARSAESVALWRKLQDKQGLAWALVNLGTATEWGQRDYETARSLQEESVALYREIGDKHGLAFSLAFLGGALLGLGDLAGGRAFFEESLALNRELNDYGSWPLLGLGAIALREADYAAAEAFYSESLSASWEAGDKPTTAWSLELLGKVALAQDDLVTAEARFLESLPLACRVGRKPIIMDCLLGLGTIAMARQQSLRAARLFGAWEAMQSPADGTEPAIESPVTGRAIAAVRTQMEEPDIAAAWTEGQAMSCDEVVDFVLQK
jgi:predicted ATPase